MTEYTVVIKKLDHNYGSWVPDVDGYVATGDSLEEVTLNIREAIEFHIEGIRLRGERILTPPSSIVTTVHVAS
jgi:predicted RNase H-like HicB family nuclease